MRKLEFLAIQQPGVTQCPAHYVTALLATQLPQYGFRTQVHEQKDAISVNVNDEKVALAVSCHINADDGSLVCEISNTHQEQQNWFGKIKSESTIRQLAQAVECSLRQDHSLNVLKWKY
ncbi:hypothetical protein [Acinetobacter rudis]|uniref:Uncharacterized protein n=1 Tax=Acinetobacter rudis TaxID=632955 RepID=A0AAW8J693_9GAMM|nr:hypothetical protein [Acinetobacter rudis]MDQ8934725.1 hypothetical protein [Acinetobacter rudis]MDQ8951389.1 hypothetical protein [Acinetobacter rudis]MDQ9017194.1 hypothetical protein [Acinetobacter rudis]